MKEKKSMHEAHCDNKGQGMGDHYGSGIKQKVGRIREDYVNASAISKNKLKKPPRSLA